MNSGEKIIGLQTNVDPHCADPQAVQPQERSPLAQLIARVEAATEGGRELDSAIAVALRDGAEGYPSRPLGSFRPGFVQADLGRDGWSVGWHVPPYTASVDAALALVERVLPGWGYDTTYRAAWGNHTACVIENDRRAVPHTGAGPTAALALLSALLRALAALAETLG